MVSQLFLTIISHNRIIETNALPTDRQTDGPKNRWMDRPSYRDADASKNHSYKNYEKNLSLVLKSRRPLCRIEQRVRCHQESANLTPKSGCQASIRGQVSE